MIKTVYISVKGSDLFDATFKFEDGTERGKNGYAPYIENVCGGDYLNIEVDNSTGKIIGWIPIKSEEVDALIKDM